jgi:hypothetical protein
MRRIFLYVISSIECLFNSGSCLSNCATISAGFQQNGTEYNLNVAFRHLEYPKTFISKIFFPEWIAFKNTCHGIVPFS